MLMETNALEMSHSLEERQTSEHSRNSRSTVDQTSQHSTNTGNFPAYANSVWSYSIAFFQEYKYGDFELLLHIFNLYYKI